LAISSGEETGCENDGLAEEDSFGAMAMAIAETDANDRLSSTLRVDAGEVIQVDLKERPIGWLEVHRGEFRPENVVEKTLVGRLHSLNIKLLAETENVPVATKSYRTYIAIPKIIQCGTLGLNKERGSKQSPTAWSSEDRVLNVIQNEWMASLVESFGVVGTTEQ
jgi:hypothetical protein